MKSNFKWIRLLNFMLLILFLILTNKAFTYESIKYKAVIYKGPGTCIGCPEAIGQILAQKNFSVKYIGPTQLTDKTFQNADLYVQPGGNDFIEDTLFSMSKSNINSLKKFIYKGGKYLGICAGGYLAGQFAENERSGAGDYIEAFGLLPIHTIQQETESNLSEPLLLDIQWLNQNRKIYYQAGPQFGKSLNQAPYRVYSRYTKTKNIAALISKFGLGNVGVIGPHPEASNEWYIEDGLSLKYGLNFDLLNQFVSDLMTNDLLR